MSNRRKHKRYPATGSVDIKYEHEGQKKLVHALITDISFSGIGLYLDIPLEDNINVSMDITFISSDGSIKTTTTSGRVVYTRKFKEVYFTGIQFHQEINQKDQPQLYEHLKALSLLNE